MKYDPGNLEEKKFARVSSGHCSQRVSWNYYQFEFIAISVAFTHDSC